MTAVTRRIVDTQYRLQQLILARTCVTHHPDCRDGYDRQGLHKDGYDRYGFDKYGYDKQGFNKDGFDRCALRLLFYGDTTNIRSTYWPPGGSGVACLCSAECD